MLVSALLLLLLLSLLLLVLLPLYWLSQSSVSPRNLHLRDGHTPPCRRGLFCAAHRALCLLRMTIATLRTLLLCMLCAINMLLCCMLCAAPRAACYVRMVVCVCACVRK